MAFLNAKSAILIFDRNMNSKCRKTRFPIRPKCCASKKKASRTAKTTIPIIEHAKNAMSAFHSR